MDENNKNTAGGEANGEKKQGNHKRRRNRHKHHGPRPEGAPEAAHANNSAETPRANGGEAQQKQPHQNQKKKSNHQSQQQHNSKGNGDSNGQKRNDNSRNGEKKSQNGGSQKKKKHHQNGGGIRTHRGPEDLYGRPTENDVLTMDELRAKIVLKSADGTPPAAKEEAAVEAVELSTEELLFPMDENPTPAASNEESVEVVGIKFRTSGKVYYFDPKKNKLRRGQFAIVETARGPEFGEVTFGNRMVRKSATVSPLRPVLRAATDDDVARNQANMEKEKEALKICREKILEHRLEMKLIDVQYAFDNSKILFYFTSEGRVDFRELVKDLASVFHTRIELRQIGIRDEAKILGGLGACGRPLCCATFLSDFVQVSIKMAKEQGLSLNSSKISGVCGRLMCCLRYESEVYAEEIKRTPPIDSTVNTPDGIGTVIGMSPLAGTVKVYLKSADTPPKSYRRDEVTVLSKEKKGNAENAAQGTPKKDAK